MACYLFDMSSESNSVRADLAAEAGDNMANITDAINSTAKKSTQSIELAYAYAGVGSGGMLANAFILVVLVSDRKFWNQSALIAGLAISHFLCAWAIGTSGIYRVVNFDVVNQRTTILECLTRIYPAAQPFAFQCMGVLLVIIGVERFTVFVFPNWYRVKWTNKLCWSLLGAGLLGVTASFCVGVYISFSQSDLTMFCGYQSIFGKHYIVYSNVISATGGTAAVVLTLLGLFRGIRSVRKLPLLSGEAGKYKKQLKLTQSMLSVAVCDFCLVVIPNTLFILSIAFPNLFPSTATGNLSNYTNVTYCISTMMTIGPYLRFHKQFRKTAVSLLTCKKENSITKTSVVHLTPIEARTVKI